MNEEILWVVWERGPRHMNDKRRGSMRVPSDRSKYTPETSFAKGLVVRFYRRK